MNQEDVLEEALRITKTERNSDYGDFPDNMAHIAAIWSAIKGVKFEPYEVPVFNMAQKISRQTHCQKRDNWVDIAGYARGGQLCDEAKE